ncbi:MAG: hypothetical protein K8J31_13310 [Anaerolineae bacterium]|nr:hypothetical protein [Anaerolineae bacterium]
MAALLVILLSRGVKRESLPRGSRQWVEYGLALKIVSAAFFPASAFVSYAAFQASPDQQVLALSIAAGFWAATIYLAYEFYFVRLSYDEDYIYHQTPLRRLRRIPWDAVKAVRYSPTTQAYTLKTAGHGDVSISPYADGHEAFIAQIHTRLNHTPPAP